jgi:hypothetical protein
MACTFYHYVTPIEQQVRLYVRECIVAKRKISHKYIQRQTSLDVKTIERLIRQERRK